jgi:hypothetical protein
MKEVMWSIGVVVWMANAAIVVLAAASIITWLIVASALLLGSCIRVV